MDTTNFSLSKKTPLPSLLSPQGSGGDKVSDIREGAAQTAGSGEEGPGDSGHAPLPGETPGGGHPGTGEEEGDSEEPHGGGRQVQRRESSSTPQTHLALYCPLLRGG